MVGLQSIPMAGSLAKRIYIMLQNLTSISNFKAIKVNIGYKSWKTKSNLNEIVEAEQNRDIN